MTLTITDDDLKIEICPECHGAKMIWKEESTSPSYSRRFQAQCDVCQGRGVKLTPTGAKLFDFFRGATRFMTF